MALMDEMFAIDPGFRRMRTRRVRASAKSNAASIRSLQARDWPIVGSHGRLDGPLRAPVLRAVTVADTTGSANSQSP